MRPLLAYGVLVALAVVSPLGAQEPPPAMESSILPQIDPAPAEENQADSSTPSEIMLPETIPELRQPREIDATQIEAPATPDPASMTVPARSTWVLNLTFPRQPHPLPLEWLRSSESVLPNGTPGLLGWFSQTGYRFWGESRDTGFRMWRDFQFQYSMYPLLELGVAVGIAAPLANTGVDQRVRDWYQGRVHPYADTSRYSSLWSNTDRVGHFIGSWQYMLPIYVGVWGAGVMAEDTWTGSVAAEWANRTLRALAVGAPEMGVLQLALGGARPLDGDGSRWRPMRDNNGVSGHAFVGAMPFLSAASMIDNPWLRAPFIAGSFWSAWSRMDSDSHYLSQILLGWFIAYQSTRAINRTEAEDRQIQITPWIDPGVTGPGITGINVFLRY